MSKPRLAPLWLVACLLLSALACGVLPDEPAEVLGPAAQTAEAAARQAGEVAQTAAAAAQQAGGAAQTAAARAGDLAGTAIVVATRDGSQAVATLLAVATPHLDYLQEKVAGIQPDDEGNYRLTLTEEEVNTVIRLRQLLTGDVLGASIQSQEVTFRDGLITLSGTILEPLPGQLRVIMRPDIIDDRLELEILEAEVAGRAAPAEALAAARRAIGGTVGEALTYLPAGVQLDEILVGDGELTIVGHRSP